jgi:hypothetical protein
MQDVLSREKPSIPHEPNWKVVVFEGVLLLLPLLHSLHCS